MPPLDSKIDDLYKGPLKEFVDRRAALARTLTGGEARQVKGLQKPTIVPWAVNQVYWHARPVYDRLSAGGEKLRAAQIAALKGKASDVRRATEAHRQSLAEAVAAAMRLAAATGARLNADELTKTLEAISLARDRPEEPGRLTRTLQPAGFEALAGIPVQATRPTAHGGHAPAVQPPGMRAPSATADPSPVAVRPTRPSLKLAEARKSAEREREAEDRRKKKALERATALVARAKAAEVRARAAWDGAKQALDAAELALRRAQT